jgi:hypothetical protein
VRTELIVKLDAATADNVAARRSVDACMAGFGLTLVPLHPSSSDVELGTYFVADVDAEAVDDLVSRLLRCKGIEGAYPKSPGEPPERM